MAATFTLPVGGFTKSKSLADHLNRLTTISGEEGDQIRFETVEEIQQDIDAAKFFRWHAPSSKNRQDVHLVKYRQFIFGVVKGMGDKWEEVDESTWIEELFSRDFKKMSNNMKTFLVYAFRSAAPRSKAANTIEMRTFCQYRDSLLFWGDWYYRTYHEENFPNRKLFNELVQSMRYTQSKYGDVFKHKEKTWLGLSELRQLLDHESIHNRCIELSEQHQVLWCIGRLTALRPGSLCPGSKYARTEPLTWRNFRFFANVDSGKFESRLTLDHITIKRQEDPMTIAEGDIQTFPLTLKFTSPEPQNIVFSPTHRLLIIALRRNILQEIDSIDDLFKYDKHEIFVKDANLDDTIFFRGTPKGTALDKTRPLTSNAMSEYLKARGWQIGYTQPISWYSIRRRAATDMVRRVGLSTTRFMLGHTPESHTLERYYLNMTETLDMMGILTEQGIQADGVSSLQVANFHPLALEKLQDAAFQRSRGQALSKLIRRIILSDTSAPDENIGSPAIKNYRRRVKRFAQKILIDTEHEWQRKNLSKADMQQRQAGLKASNFANAVLEAALTAMADHNQTVPDVGEEGAPVAAAAAAATTASGQDDDANAMPVEDNEQHEEDLEQTLQQPLTLNADNTLDVVNDVEADIENPTTAPAADASYGQLAKSAMQLWLDNELSTHATWAMMNKICPLCQDDPTATDEQRAKQFKSQAKLDDHIEGNFHHPSMRWRRGIELYWKDRYKYTCGYCKEAELEKIFTGFTFADLMGHVLDSDAANTSEIHDQLKAADGLYDEVWEDPRAIGPSAKTVEKYEGAGRKKLTATGIDMSPMRQLVKPLPHPSIPGVLQGLSPPLPLPARYSGVLQSGAPTLQSGQTLIPPHLRGAIKPGHNPVLTDNPTPAHMQGKLAKTTVPSTFKDLPKP